MCPLVGVAWRVGWDLRTARERVRVARKLADLPLVDEELRRGLAALHDAHAALGITANSNASRWTGEAIDYARCIDYLV